jgi:hypothetical protein
VARMAWMGRDKNSIEKLDDQRETYHGGATVLVPPGGATDVIPPGSNKRGSYPKWYFEVPCVQNGIVPTPKWYFEVPRVQNGIL